MAESACTLTDSEFDALTRLTGLDRADRERLLISADRFTRPDENLPVSSGDRIALVKRLGLFGVRLASVLVRTGVRDRQALAEALVRRSGVEDLRDILDRHFRARSEYLRARTALITIDALLRERPLPEARRLKSARERIIASNHEFKEVRLLFAPPGDGLTLPPDLDSEARRLIGGEGTAPRRRLGLADKATDDEVRAAASEALDRWRRLAEDPLVDRPIVEICRIVTRSCEAVLVTAESAESRTGSRTRATPRPVAQAEPRVRSGRETGDERRAG